MMVSAGKKLQPITIRFQNGIELILVAALKDIVKQVKNIKGE